MKVERDSSIELLRLILMLFVVLTHAFIAQLAKNWGEVAFISQSVVVSFTVVAVNCFVFISGFYGMKFKQKTLVSLITQALFYSVGGMIIFSLLGFEYTNTQILRSLLPISSQRWWFLSVYVALFMIAPYLNYAIEYLSKKQLLATLIGILFIDCFMGFLYGTVANDGYHIFHFLILYILARSMSVYKIEIKYPLLWYIIPCLLILIGNTGISHILGHGTFPGFRYNDPLLIIAAVGLFYTFKGIKIRNSFINSIAPLAFGVYLFHLQREAWEIFLEICRKLNMMFADRVFLLFVALFAFSLIVFISGLFVEKIRQLICNPIVNVISKRIERINFDKVVNWVFPK